MNHVAIFLISVFFGLQLLITGLLYPEVQGSSVFILMFTAVAVGLIGGVLRELEVALVVAQEKRVTSR